MSPTDTTLPSLCELAELRLRESPYYFFRALTCHGDEGAVTLRGTVPHNRLREIAECLVAQVEGVLTIHNQIEIHDPAFRRRVA